MPPAIDRAQLSVQTFGDAALEHEILFMFREQAAPLLQALATAAGPARSDVAHRIKGSALAIGAAQLAEAAQRLELAPDEPAALRAVEDACRQVLQEIGGIAAA